MKIIEIREKKLFFKDLKMLHTTYIDEIAYTREKKTSKT